VLLSKHLFFFRKEIKFYFEYLVENDIVVYVSNLETQDNFWKVIRTFENVILSGNNLLFQLQHQQL